MTPNVVASASRPPRLPIVFSDPEERLQRFLQLQAGRRSSCEQAVKIDRKLPELLSDLYCIDLDSREEAHRDLGGVFVQRLKDSLMSNETATESLRLSALRRFELIRHGFSAQSAANERIVCGTGFKETEQDGKLLGADLLCYDIKYLLDMPHLYPTGKIPTVGRELPDVIFVNGLVTPVSAHFLDMRMLADQSGLSVVGAHLATHGRVLDYGAAAALRIIRQFGSSVTQLQKLFTAYIVAGKVPRIAAFSDGAYKVSGALQRLESRVETCGLKKDTVIQWLDEVRVITIGGGAWRMPSRGRFTHVVNESDPFPFYFGVARATKINADKVSLPQMRGTPWEGLLRAATLLVKLKFVNCNPRPGPEPRFVVFDSGREVDPHSSDAYFGPLGQAGLVIRDAL
jgi:hypothetical protein